MNLCKSKRCYNGCVPLQTRAAALATVAYTNSESSKKKKKVQRLAAAVAVPACRTGPI